MDTQFNTQVDIKFETIIECIKKSDLSFYEFKLGDILKLITSSDEKSAINYLIKQHYYKDNSKQYLKNIVSNLQKLKLPEQRSPEWYELRKGLLTASSLASALGHDHFKSREQLIYDKTSIEEVPYVSNPITEWGVKYEEIATKFYEYLNNVKIIEFGLIPHREFKIFGASPDGICSNDSPYDYIGRMLEIKCPPKRKFTKTVPKHYWYQMQGQLECCNLDECDFLQVKLLEYDDYDDYSKDICKLNEEIKWGYTKNELPKGCTFSYRKKDELKLTYRYPDFFKTDDEYKKWIDDQIIDIKEQGHEYVEAKWWKIERYECTLVKRDKEWWTETMEDIFKFSKDVQYYKEHPEERDGLKTKRKYVNNDISKVDECLL